MFQIEGNASNYTEILRLKGWVLSRRGDLEGAEGNFLASLGWARRQQAKSCELRTSTRLAGLWQSQEKRQDAYELLAHAGSPKLRHQGFASEGQLAELEGSKHVVRLPEPFLVDVPLSAIMR
jgi:hypothetical protein